MRTTMDVDLDCERRLELYIKDVFEGDSSGHDYFHSIRVYKMAMKIAEEECCDRNIVMMSALLHDVDDRKLFQTVDYANARKILQDCAASQTDIERVLTAIKSVSYKGRDSVIPQTIEGKIVQDADRLDAMGAIGIARTFAYGGSQGQKIYDPEIPPMPDMDEEEYQQHQGTTINHFYEKLLLIKDMLNTDTARRIAEKRQLFMERFLEEFYAEWNGEEEYGNKVGI